MSGYRTLHRGQPLRARKLPLDDDGGTDEGVTTTTIPLWAASFVPPTTTTHTTSAGRGTRAPTPQPPLRLMVASADRTVRCYDVADKSLHSHSDGGDPMLDASAINVKLRSILVSSQYPKEGDGKSSSSPLPASAAMQLGFTDLSVVRGKKEGESIAAAIGLDGTVVVWRLGSEEWEGGSGNGNSDAIPHRRPEAEFIVEDATGTSVVLKAVDETMAVVAVGCRDGSVVVHHAAPLVSSVEGETTTRNKKHDPPEPGTFLTKMGSGSACVSSLAWSNCGRKIAAGRTDGMVDVFEISPEQDDWRNRYHPPSFHRVHRIPAHSKRVRAVEFSLPDDALLLTGGDDGRVHSYDVRRPVGVAAALTGSYVGHRGWILDVRSCPDGRRFATSSSDRTVKVWEYATRSNVHTFDGHDDLVWSVSFGCSSPSPTDGVAGASGAGAGAGSRLVSCGDDGTMQIYSTSI